MNDSFRSDFKQFKSFVYLRNMQKFLLINLKFVLKTSISKSIPQGSFYDIESLTMFADYRVPQSLQHYGALQYSDQLLQCLAADTCLEPGHVWEQEIRGCSIEAVQRITRRVLQELEEKKVEATVNSILIDQYLWGYRREHAEIMKKIPYHKVRSIFY